MMKRVGLIIMLMGLVLAGFGTVTAFPFFVDGLEMRRSFYMFQDYIILSWQLSFGAGVLCLWMNKVADIKLWLGSLMICFALLPAMVIPTGVITYSHIAQPMMLFGTAAIAFGAGIYMTWRLYT